MLPVGGMLWFRGQWALAFGDVTSLDIWVNGGTSSGQVGF